MSRAAFSSMGGTGTVPISYAATALLVCYWSAAVAKI